MLAEATDVESVLTDSESEALLLENNWITETRPRYNVRLRDDKTYPYRKLTADPYPRIAFTCRIRDGGADYFGPFLPGGLARKAIKLVQKLFEVRVCRIDIDGSLLRLCLYYGIGRCLGLGGDRLFFSLSAGAEGLHARLQEISCPRSTLLRGWLLGEPTFND